VKPEDGRHNAKLDNVCFSGDQTKQEGGEPLSQFLPPERDDLAELQEQRKLLFQDQLTRIIFDGFPDGGFILNEKRQILAVNQAITQRFTSLCEDNVLGMRPGEALGCRHSHETPHGCGTTSFCRYCGAAQVLFQVRMGKPAHEQCHIVTELEKESLELLIWGTPFERSGRGFTLFAVVDISNEKRRQALERIFFHDVFNTVNSMLGAAEILSLKANPEIKHWVRVIQESGDILAREIKSQRQLLLAESGTLETVISKFLSDDLIRSVIQHCSQLTASKNRTVTAHPDNQGFVVNSDVSLLKRILINLVKNAMEATVEGGRVVIRTDQTHESWSISVQNQAFISIDDQQSLFKRSFSTKGKGRGLGLYGVRLLTEKYLNGKVRFESDPEQGTTFYIDLPKEQNS
jgi:signal transduction histidine kinase